MNPTRHASRRAAAKLVRAWWDNHQRLWAEWDNRQRDRAISPCVCAGCRANPQQQHGEIARLDAKIAHIEAEIDKSATEGARLHTHPRTRGCFDAPLIPTASVLAWKQPVPTVTGGRWQGAYSRRAERRDMRRRYGADWWRPADE